MANRSTNKTSKRRRRIGWIIFATLFVLLLGTLGFGLVNASTLHVRKAEVYVPDLPATFEGVKLLYLSDIDLCGVNTAERAGAAVMRLEALQPDFLLLGGDYASASLFDLLDRQSPEDGAAESLNKCTDFFHYIRDFSAPLGKYAIMSPEDIDPSQLRTVMTENGITPLFNDAAGMTIGSDTLWLAGLCDDQLIGDGTSNRFKRGDCVVSVAYSPTCFPQMMTLEASDSGPWVDIALAGHTHGGQIRLFGRNILSLSSQEQQYLYGWHRDTGTPMLTTSGIGCEAINLRYGSQAEAWLITLTSHPPVQALQQP